LKEKESGSHLESLEYSTSMNKIHPEFISLSEACQGIRIQMDYSSIHNFTGQVVPGYKAQKAYMAKPSAEALGRVQKKALELGLSLKIFDAYRPVKAVSFFQDWAQLPETNPALKAIYYPGFSRIDLFEQGFIAKQSSHSRGSAVDLTLCDHHSGHDLDMGSAFDYFDVISHTDNDSISDEQIKNRRLLKSLMESEGFKNFFQEWWHFSLRPEPFPHDAFDFDIE